MAGPTHDQLQAALQKAIAAGNQQAAAELRSAIAATPQTVDEETRIRQGIERARAAGNQQAVQELQQHLLKTQQSVHEAQQARAVADESPYQRFTEGMGHGAMRVLDKVFPLPGRQQRAEDEAAGVNRALMSNPTARSGDTTGAGMVAAVPGLAAGPAVRALPLSLAAAAEGAGQGALVAPKGRALSGAISGGLGGLATGAALAGAGRAITGPVKVTPEAERLMNQGVDLTMGQAAGPHSAVGLMEETTAHVPGASGITARAKERSLRSLQQTAGRRVVPPGGQFTPGASAVEESNDLFHNQFPAAYGPIKGHQVYPAIHNGRGGVTLQQAMHDAIDNADVYLDNVQRESIHQFADRKLTKVLPQQGALQKVDAGDLIDLRHDFRTKARELKKFGRVQEGLGFEAAADSVTQALDSQLPAQAASTLKTVDRQYAKFRTYEEAVARGQDMEGGFRPQQWTQAENADMGRTRRMRYAQGDPNHELMADAKLAMQEAPRTGWVAAPLALGAGALHHAGVVGSPLAGAVAATAAIPAAASLAGNASPLLKSYLLGRNVPQQQARIFLRALAQRAPDTAATAAGAAGAAFDPLP